MGKREPTATSGSDSKSLRVRAWDGPGVPLYERQIQHAGLEDMIPTEDLVLTEDMVLAQGLGDAALCGGPK